MLSKEQLAANSSKQENEEKAKPRLLVIFVWTGLPLFDVQDRFRYREGISGGYTAYGHASW